MGHRRRCSWTRCPQPRSRPCDTCGEVVAIVAIASGSAPRILPQAELDKLPVIFEAACWHQQRVLEGHSGHSGRPAGAADAACRATSWGTAPTARRRWHRHTFELPPVPT
jgi:hypothetical protein